MKIFIILNFEYNIFEKIFIIGERDLQRSKWP